MGWIWAILSLMNAPTYINVPSRYKRDLELMHEETRSIRKEIAEINKDHNYEDKGRSDGSTARLKILWEALRRADERFNWAHPMPPCPKCGTPRKATLGETCLNWGECSNAVAWEEEQ